MSWAIYAASDSLLGGVLQTQVPAIKLVSIHGRDKKRAETAKVSGVLRRELNGGKSEP